VGQKVHPLGFRLGIFEDWNVHWFAKKDFGKFLIEDLKIRKFLQNHLSKSDTARVVLDKAGDNIKIVIFSSRPGIVIGKKGHGIDELKKALFREFGKNVEVSVQEERNFDTNAYLVARSIADQLEKRVSFKRAMKKAGQSSLRSGAKGIKICCAGRLGGAEIARSEWLRLGSIPLHTLRSNVDYALAEAKTTYGIIGVKVWICRGEYSEK